MDLTELKFYINNDTLPDNLHHLLEALIFEARGDWKKAHDIAQEDKSRDGAWVHGYLHRKEGDIWNARYWYSRSGRPFTTKTFREEWEDLVSYFLKQDESIRTKN
ncbi:MAG: hypothetical protein ACOC2F_01445 [Bacteroidota bacterium]